MTKTTLLALAILAWPALNLAHSAPETTTVVAATAAADPAAPVPALHYQSPLAYQPRGVAQGTDDWAAANTRVGQFTRGHADILKAEQAQDMGTPTKPAVPAPGAQP